MQTRNTIALRKSEIKRCREMMNKEAEATKKLAGDAISEHYLKVSEAVGEAERKTRATFKKLCEVQRQTINANNVSTAHYV